MAATIDNLVEQLKAHHASLGDGRDCKSDNERADFFARSSSLAQTISALMNLPADVAREQARLADLEARRAAVVEKQAELERQLADAVDPATLDDARARDKAYDRGQHLARQLHMLRDGTLYTAPGVVYERLADLDARIAELTERRDRAQAALDAHLKTAETLLGAVVTS